MGKQDLLTFFFKSQVDSGRTVYSTARFRSRCVCPRDQGFHTKAGIFSVKSTKRNQKCNPQAKRSPNIFLLYFMEMQELFHLKVNATFTNLEFSPWVSGLHKPTFQLSRRTRRLASLCAVSSGHWTKNFKHLDWIKRFKRSASGRAI